MIEARSQNTESELIQSIVLGDDKAINILYLEYYPVIRHFIEKNNGDESSAKDIYQDAFIILIRNIKRGTFKGDSTVRTYLYSISRRLWLKELNKRNSRQSKIRDIHEFLSTDDYNENAWEDRDKKIKKLGVALQGLGEPCGTILLDFYVNGLSMESIKSKMGYTNAGNAKNQKYKCMQRLRKIFFKQ